MLLSVPQYVHALSTVVPSRLSVASVSFPAVLFKTAQYVNRIIDLRQVDCAVPIRRRPVLKSSSFGVTEILGPVLVQIA